MSVCVGVKNWDIATPDCVLVEKLCLSLGISRPVAALLPSRGVASVEQARDYLFPLDVETAPFNPFLFKEMDAAADCMLRAIETNKKICIYGDYDVDGITAVSVFCRYFRSIGFENFSYYIPDRLSEGYGMNTEAVELLAAVGVDLIVTVDNGVSAAGEIKRAYELGVSVIVTDHHECRAELPECVAVINPKRIDSTYPFDQLAGVATAYKLVCACEIKRSGNTDSLPPELEQLVAIGTVADMMQLVGENRFIVKRGLESLANNPITGIYQLARAQVSEKNLQGAPFEMPNIDSNFISFGIAPRINAAGRIGKTRDAVVLLTTDDPHEAFENAKILCALNGKRQSIETEIFEQACRIIEKEHNFENENVIVVASEGWDHGVIGIVASRVTEKYRLPCILICLEGDEGKGSARSIEGFNINGAISYCKSLLVRFGGHELAAGLTIMRKNVPELRKMINGFAKELITEEMRSGKTHIDLELVPEEITEKITREMAVLEPFGNGNPMPLFCLRDAQISAITPIGGNKHLKLSLSKSGCFFTALMFGTAPSAFKLRVGERADFAFNLDINDFGGRKTVQLIVRDCRLCKEHECEVLKAVSDSKGAIEGWLGLDKTAVPTIEGMRRFFVYLKSALGEFSPGENIRFLACGYEKACGEDFYVSLLKTIFMMTIFDEMGLVSFSLEATGAFRAEMKPVSGKVDMESSAVLATLKNAVN